MKIEQWLSDVYQDSYVGNKIWNKVSNGGSEMVADIRGWGAIQYLFKTNEEAKQFQNEVCKFIVEAIREKIVRDYPKNISDELSKPLLVASKIRATIIKFGEEWWVSHNLADPYGQIPMQLPIHSVVVTSELSLNQMVNINIVFENNEYFAMLVNT
jgi:hypothetical protein